ncbi:MAG: response regulator [Candidatus Omnitrophica bacterium]|nr:response regulator [Candidatus Omnitrophota bacterium]
MARILVVDDDAALAETCSRMLETLGYETAAAFDTGQFLDRLDKYKFDLLISDINMPDLDGFMSCRRAVALQPDIGIIMMTGQVDLDGVVEEILKSQPFHLIRKPFTLEMLKEAVEKALPQTHVC